MVLYGLMYCYFHRTYAENYGVKIKHMRCVPTLHWKERDVVKNHIHTDL